MKTARMQTPDRKNPSVQKRVYRQAKNLVVVDHWLIGTASASIPSSVDKPTEISNTKNGFDNTSASSLSEPPTNSSKETTTTATAEDANLPKRVLPLFDDMSVKKQRRTSKQKHRDAADKKRQNQKEVDAIKMATREIHTRKMVPGMRKVSQIKVVAKVNRYMGTNISSKTVSQMVREGRIGV